MTDEEKQLFKVTAEATFKPLGNLLERLFGGAVDQIGGVWEDRLKARRCLRRAKVYTKLKQQLDEAGVDPQEIPEKIWAPALQAVSLEDDETLQDKWASLLANAAIPEAAQTVSTMFPKVLANLSAREAKVLDLYFDMISRSLPADLELEPNRPTMIAALSKIEMPHLAHVLSSEFEWQGDLEAKKIFDRLVAEGLVDIRRTFDSTAASRLTNKVSATAKIPVHLASDLARLFDDSYGLTLFGVEFVIACRPPSKRP